MLKASVSSFFRSTNPIVYNSIACFGANTFYKKDLNIELTKNKKQKPVFDSSLKFGTATSDHMLEIDWSAGKGWEKPKIVPYHSFQMDPCNSTLHYAIECFEGFKAFVDPNGKTRLFRADKNMERFRSSSARLGLPDFNGTELLDCIKELIRVDRDWIPAKPGFSCYIRPTHISMTDVLGVRSADKSKIFVVLCPVGPYFQDGFKPLRIFTENYHSRAFPGGAGHYKLGANYAPSIVVSKEAEKKGYHQVLWLTNKQITEIGASNFFFYWVNEHGEKELVTCPTDGLALPGVVRDSVLNLARDMKRFKVSERYVTIDEFIKGIKEQRMLEAFGAGTAVTIGPVSLLHFDGVDYQIPIDPKYQAGTLTKELSDTIHNIQYGYIQHPWSILVD